MHKQKFSLIKFPTQELPDNIERVSLLSIWAHHFDDLGKKVLHAGIGKPTYPMSEKIPTIIIEKQKKLLAKFKKYNQLSTSLHKAKDLAEYSKIEKAIIDLELVIDYGHPQGDLAARTKIAKKISDWYNTAVSPGDILFTTGGVGALYCIFEYLNKYHAQGVVLTQFPYYPLYKEGRLFPIDVLQEPGYRLTAHALRKSMALARKEHKEIAAFLFCDPNNPMSTAIAPEEWRLIIKELHKVPNALIMLDEAYAEICFTHEHESLFTMADAKLRERIILLRSGTKGCSTSGSRMSVLVTLNKKIMKTLLEINISTTLHAESLSQEVYAEIFPVRGSKQITQMKNFYQKQVIYTYNRLRKLNIALPDHEYVPQGSFYVIADLKKLMGLQLSKADQKLLAPMFIHVPEKITTDEQLAYWLLAKYQIMLCPLSYFGVDPTHGWLRITCSLGHLQLERILQTLEDILRLKPA
jgi:aspartate aminotransferase/aminotransferase